MKPLKKHATYADLCEVPEHFVAEMFDGELYATPRPAPLHTQVSSALGMELAVFHHSGGGWRILDEPELHFGNDVLVPDIAAWRSRAPACVARRSVLSDCTGLDLRSALVVHGAH